MAGKSPKQNNIFILLFLAISALVVFYGCGGVSSDGIPDAECIITGLIRPNAALQSTLTSLASLRGANYSGIEVWTVADGYSKRVLTDEDGHYTIITKPGTHRICAKYVVGSEVYRAVSKPMEAVRNGGENKWTTLELSTCNVSVKGHIVDVSGYAPTGVTNITVLGEPVTVDANGWYETPLMPEGWIEEVVINVGGYQEVRQTVNFEENTPYIENTIVRNNETNRAPYITIASGTPRTDSLNKGESVRLYVGFADLDGDIATWSWNIAVSDGSSIGSFSEYTNDRGRTFSSISWRAPEADIVATITFTVKDYGNLVAKTLFCYKVAAGKPNSAPVINDVLCDGVSVLADPSIQGRSRHEFVAFANDPDQDKIIYKWSISYLYNDVEYKEDRFTADINGGKNINGTASAATIIGRMPSNPYVDAYPATLTLIVEDTYGAKTTNEYSVAITTDPENNLPVISLATATIVNAGDIANYAGSGGYGAGAFHIKSGATLRLSVIATDTEGEDLEYAWADESNLASGTFSNTLSTTPTITWVAPYSYSETGAPLTLRLKVYDIDPETGTRYYYLAWNPTKNAYERVYYHYSERIINVKVYKGDYGEPKVVFREKDGSSFVGKAYIKTDSASLTANLLASYTNPITGLDSDKGMPIKQYRWSYVYDRTNADGSHYEDPETHYLGGESANFYWVTTNLVSGEYPASNTYAWPAGNETGTYTIRFEARGWNDDNIYEATGSLYVNATPTLQLAIATDTTQFPLTRAREALDLDGNKIIVVNEGETFILVSRIKDEFWETKHELCWYIEGVASYTESKTSGTGFPYNYQATRQINTSSLGSLVPGTPITLKLGIKDTLEEAATSSSVIIEYNAKPKDISIVYDPPFAHDDRNCYYPEESINLTVSSDDVETGKDLLGHGGLGGVTWEYAKKTGASYGAYTALPYVGYNPANPATGTAANVTLNCSSLGTGTYKLRVTVTDNMYGSTTWADDEHEFVIADHQNVSWDPAPKSVIQFLTDGNDPDLNGNTNPAVVTIGKSFKLAVSYSGSLRKKVEWKYKALDAANYTDMSAEGTSLSYTVSDSLITTPGTYTLCCNIIGASDESASVTYDIRVNNPPEVTLSFSPELGAGVTAYNKGSNITMRLSVTDVEDGNSVVTSTTSTPGTTYGRFSIEGPLNQSGIANPYQFNTVGDYIVTGVITDTLGAKATATANIVISNTPTVSFTAVSGANVTPVQKGENFKLNITVAGIDSMDEVNSIDWVDKITDLGGTTSNVTGSFELRTADNLLTRLYLNSSKPAAANHDYGVVVTLKSGLTANATFSMRINEVPTSSEISITSGTQFQTGLYDKTVPMTFQISSTDSDVNDMPTFKWYLTAPGGSRTLVQEKTVTITDLQAGDASKIDSYELNGTTDGVYLVECEITDDTGAAAETRSISVIRTTNIVINDFVTSYNSTNPTYRLTSNTSPAQLQAVLAEPYNSTRDNVDWTLDANPLAGTKNYSGTNLNYEVMASQLTAVGTHTIRVTLSNDYGVTASKSYDIYLNQTPTVSPITISGSGVDVPDPLDSTNYVLHATSTDGDAKDAINFIWRITEINPPIGGITTPVEVGNHTNASEVTSKEDTLNLNSLTAFFKMDHRYTVECGLIDSWGEPSLASATITFSTNTKPVISNVTYSYTAGNVIPSGVEYNYNGNPMLVTSQNSLSVTFGVELNPVKPLSAYEWYAGDNPVGVSGTGATYQDTFQNIASVSVVVKDTVGDYSEMASRKLHVVRGKEFINGVAGNVNDILINNSDPVQVGYVNVGNEYIDFYNIITPSGSPVYSGSVWTNESITGIRSASIIGVGTKIAANQKVKTPDGSADRPGEDIVIYSECVDKAGVTMPGSTTVYLYGSDGVSNPTMRNFKYMVAVSETIMYAIGTDNKLYTIAVGPTRTVQRDPDETPESGDEYTINCASGTVSVSTITNARHIRYFNNKIYLASGNNVYVYDTSLSEEKRYSINNALDVFKAANHIFVLTTDGKVVIGKDTLPVADWTTLNLSSYITDPKSLQYFRDSNGGYLLVYHGSNIKSLWLGPGEW